MGAETAKMWFIQLNGQKRGPFPAWQIGRYLLLQRLDKKSLVSRDGEAWSELGTLPELHPENRLKIADLDMAERHRLEATNNWVKENPNLFKTRPSESTEEGAEAEPHYHLEVKPRKAPNRVISYSLVALLFIGVVAIPLLIPAPEERDDPQCEAAAAPGVNWSNCIMSSSQLSGSDLTGAVLRNVNLRSSALVQAKMTGSDLAYANLSGTNLAGAQLQNSQLKGANLRNANLRDANLEGVDLSYADLTGAKLKGANLKNTRLGYAIWDDEIRCMPESVDRCIPGRK